jgi:integrase
MTYAKKQLPKYCLHKATGRAFVRIEGKMYYLGQHGSQASRREYDRIIGEFVANGRQALYDVGETLIESLIFRFRDHLEKERKCARGLKMRVQMVLREVDHLYGKLPVTQFTPTALKTIRRKFLDRGLCLDTINAYIGIIKQAFTWGCEEEIVPAPVAGALRMVKALQKGQSIAVEYGDIKPVEDSVMEKTLEYLNNPQIRDMIRVQRLIGGRPQDVFNMRFCDVDRSNEIWKYVPFTHKTKHRGKTRELAIGPKAQQILLKYLEQCKTPEQFVFPRPKVKYPMSWYANSIA